MLVFEVLTVVRIAQIHAPQDAAQRPRDRLEGITLLVAVEDREVAGDHLGQGLAATPGVGFGSLNKPGVETQGELGLHGISRRGQE